MPRHRDAGDAGHGEGLGSLAAVSLLTGLLWRAEIEVRWGWASLAWIGGFHWAYPAGALLFVGWVLSQRIATTAARRQFAAAAASLSVFAYVLGSWAMSWAIMRIIGFLPYGLLFAAQGAPYCVYAGLGIAYFGMTHKLLAPGLRRLAIGAALYALAFPAAMLLLWITRHRGGADVIHAIKSGFVFPLITFALGLPAASRSVRPGAGGDDA